MLLIRTRAMFAARRHNTATKCDRLSCNWNVNKWVYIEIVRREVGGFAKRWRDVGVVPLARTRQFQWQERVRWTALRVSRPTDREWHLKTWIWNRRVRFEFFFLNTGSAFDWNRQWVVSWSIFWNRLQSIVWLGN